MEVITPKPSDGYSYLSKCLVTDEGEVLLNRNIYARQFDYYKDVSTYDDRISLGGLPPIALAYIDTYHSPISIVMLSIAGEVIIINEHNPTSYTLPSKPVVRLSVVQSQIHIMDSDDDLYQLVLTNGRYQLSDVCVPNTKLFQHESGTGLAVVDNDDTLHIFHYNIWDEEVESIRVGFQVKWLLYNYYIYLIDNDHNVYRVVKGEVVKMITLSMDVNYVAMNVGNNVTTIDSQGRLIYYNLMYGDRIHIEGTYDGFYHLGYRNNLVLADGYPALHINGVTLGVKYQLPFRLFHFEKEFH